MFSSLCWLSLLFLFARFSVLSLFRCFLFSFSFFASFSSFLLFFLAFSSSALFSLLSSSFLFLPLLLFPSFPSSSSSFSFPFWFLLLLSPLAPLSQLLSQLSLPFLLPFSSSCLSSSSSFVKSPLLSSSFVFVSFPLPSSSLHDGYSSFSSVLAASLVISLFFLFTFLAFGLRFLSVCVFGLFWCFSVFLVLVFSVPEFSFRTCICFLSSSLVGSFSCLCFCFFCLLLGSSLSSLFCVASFCSSCSSSTWFHPVASAAVPLSPAPSSSASLYFAPSSVPQPSSFRLRWEGGGGVGSGTETALT